LDKPELPKPEKLTTDFVISDDPIDPETHDDPPLIPEIFDDIATTNTKLPDPEVADEDYGILPFASVNPEYCGGEKALFAFLRKELKYPEIPLQWRFRNSACSICGWQGWSSARC
jgi:hypothetical protein